LPGPDVFEAPSVTSRATHEVFNQPPPFADVDLFAGDAALAGAAAAFAAGGAEEASLSALGRRWGSAEMLEHGCRRRRPTARGRCRMWKRGC
jgi:hypothetical protein